MSHSIKKVSSASKSKQLLCISGVEEMYYIVCTYTYTSDPSRSYIHAVPCTHPQLVEEMHYIVYYYHKLGFLSSYFCQKVALTKDAIDDLMILLDCNEESCVNSTELVRVTPFLNECYSPNEPLVRMTFSNPPVLGYVRLFNKLWYVPLFEGQHLVCKPVSNHLTLLMKWYEESCQSGLDREVIHKRLNKLIEQKDKPVESVEQNEPMEEVEINSREAIDAYLDLYLHPRKYEKVLLSTVYHDFIKKSKVNISQAAFIKQLRTSSRFTISRQANGMMILDYGIIDQIEQFSRRQIMYMSFEDSYSTNHSNILSEFNSSATLCHDCRSIPFGREAYFLLRCVNQLSVSVAHIKYFVDDKHTEGLLESCRGYLNSLQSKEMDHIRHDDLNDTPKNIVMEQFDKFKSLRSFHYYPFTFSALKASILKKTSSECYDAAFLNQYSYE